MKQSFHFHGPLLSLLFLFLLSSYSITASRLLIPKLGEEDMVNADGFPLTVPTLEVEQVLMGVEDCDNGDEKCLKRRMISEAHLDYIYTQQHNP